MVQPLRKNWFTVRDVSDFLGKWAISAITGPIKRAWLIAKRVGTNQISDWSDTRDFLQSDHQTKH
jgi:hypothetical protein